MATLCQNDSFSERKQQQRPKAKQVLRNKERRKGKQREGDRHRERERTPHHGVISSHKKLRAFAVCEVGEEPSLFALSFTVVVVGCEYPLHQNPSFLLPLRSYEAIERLK